jgi:hypothetical protein
MAILTITIGGSQYSYDASPEQIAGLGATRSAVMSKLSPGEGQTEDTPIAKRPGYIATDVGYLEASVAARVAQAPEEAPLEIVERALNSWAGLPAPEAPPAEPLSPEAQLASLLAYAAEKRWQVEIAGTTWQGHGVHTDRESQTKLLAAFVQLGAGLRTDPSPWKLQDGFMSLTNAQMSEVITAALTHVQTAFATEAAIEALIADGTITTKDQINEAFA